MANRSLTKDIHRLMKRIERLTDGQAALSDFDWDDGGDFNKFRVTIRPNAGYYKGGRFKFLFVYLEGQEDDDIPNIVCETPIYHPNIDSRPRELDYDETNICLDWNTWHPVHGLEGLVLSILGLLYNPNLDDPLSGEINASLGLEGFAKNVEDYLSTGTVSGRVYDTDFRYIGGKFYDLNDVKNAKDTAECGVTEYDNDNMDTDLGLTAETKVDECTARSVDDNALNDILEKEAVCVYPMLADVTHSNGDRVEDAVDYNPLNSKNCDVTESDSVDKGSATFSNATDVQDLNGEGLNEELKPGIFFIREVYFGEVYHCIGFTDESLQLEDDDVVNDVNMTMINNETTDIYNANANIDLPDDMDTEDGSKSEDLADLEIGRTFTAELSETLCYKSNTNTTIENQADAKFTLSKSITASPFARDVPCLSRSLTVPI